MVANIINGTTTVIFQSIDFSLCKEKKEITQLLEI